MSTPTYAPAPPAVFPSIYGQSIYGQSIYGQPGQHWQLGFDQPTAPPFGITAAPVYPQAFGQLPFAQGQPIGQGQAMGYGIGAPYGHQLPGSPFGVTDPLGLLAQVLPQLLWAAQQNIWAASHLVAQLTPLPSRFGSPAEGMLMRQLPRPYAMGW